MSLFTKEQLEKLPELYAQDGKGENAIVYIAVHLDGYVWLLTEYCSESKNFFGFVSLNDPEMAELGYINQFELENLACKYPLVVDSIEMELKDAKVKYIN